MAYIFNTCLTYPIHSDVISHEITKWRPKEEKFSNSIGKNIFLVFLIIIFKIY